LHVTDKLWLCTIYVFRDIHVLKGFVVRELFNLGISTHTHTHDRPCVLVVSVLGSETGVPDTIFCVAVGLERGSLSLMGINEELLERKSSGSGLEN
jgi:hypothetical protein